MSLADGALIYLLWWWVILFAVLPWRVSPPTEVPKGHDAGAPEKPYLPAKVCDYFGAGGAGDFFRLAGDSSGRKSPRRGVGGLARVWLMRFFSFEWAKFISAGPAASHRFMAQQPWAK